MSESFCVHTEFLNDFIDKNFNDIRAPFSAGFELTAKCNLNCVHCYANHGRTHADFSFDEFKSIFDVLVDRGMLEAYFTGGEIFTRPDFEKMYLYAKSKGVLMVLLSNITLLTERHIELFQEYPVELVSTTMYGCSEKTYEGVTGVKGSYSVRNGTLKVEKAGKGQLLAIDKETKKTIATLDIKVKKDKKSTKKTTKKTATAKKKAKTTKK